MSKWVYDPKTASMVPVKHTNELDFQMTGAGFKISDHKHNLIFTVGPDDSISFNDRGIHQYLFTDYRTAAIVAQRIRRVYPNSRFATAEGLLSWRRGAHPELDHPHYNESMSADDKAMLRCLLEEVDNKDAEKYVESLNETGYWFGLGGKSSVGQTPGTTQHGVKGLVNALPSAVLSFLICPPATILRWIGAVRKRSEARWLKTRINPNRWLDFVATPWEKQEKVREQIRKEMAENTQYYYTKLANGEILRVVGSSTLEAKEMVMALEHKDIIPRYEEWNNTLSLTSDSEDNVSISPNGKTPYIMWVIKFDNGEACYAFGKPDASDKEDIMEKAIESRKTMVEYYKHIRYRDEDNGDRKKQRHGGIGSEDDEFLKLFTVPKIDDMVKINNPSSYKIIGEENYKDFSTPQTGRIEWSPNGNIVYKINFNNIGTITLPLRSPLEVKTVLSELVKAEGGFAKKIAELCNCGRKNYNQIDCTKIVGANKDFFIVPCINNNNVTGVEPTISVSQAKDYFLSIEEEIRNVVENADISKESKQDYKKAQNNDRQAAIYTNAEPDDFDSVYNKSWSRRITYQKVDSKTGEELSQVEYFDGGIDDNNIVGNPLPKRQQQQQAQQA